MAVGMMIETEPRFEVRPRQHKLNERDTNGGELKSSGMGKRNFAIILNVFIF